MTTPRATGAIAAGMGGSGPVVVARGLTKRFGSILALDGLELEVPRGIVFGLLGPNGAGKTTAIRLLTGLARPTSGTAEVAGIRVGTRNGLEVRRRTGVLDQDPRFYGWMTGRELLAFAADLVGVPRGEMKARVEETLERVGLADAANRRIAGYSGGMRQRIGIGQAIVGRPDLLILDEPVSSLDPEGRRDLLNLIGELRRTATVVFSTHVLADVERVADRVAILDAGRLVVEAPIAELLDRFALPVYAIDAEPGQDGTLTTLGARLTQEAWVSGTSIEGGVLRVAVSDPSRAARDLLPLVVAAGVRVASFSRQRPTLEDVFLRLVGRDARTGSADREGPIA